MSDPEFKIRTVYPWSNNPVYEVLISDRKGKGWFALRDATGAPARFTGIPGSLEEARNIINEHKDVRKTSGE